jgi:hypothetical protein
VAAAPPAAVARLPDLLDELQGLVLLDLPGWASKAIDGDAANGVRWTTPTGHAYDSRPPPILGHGNTKPPPNRPRRRPRWPVIELHKDPVAIDYQAHHRRTDN